MSLAAFKQDARNYKPSLRSGSFQERAEPKPKKIPWRIVYIKELHQKQKGQDKGEVVADLDVIDVKTGICLQGLNLVRYGRETIFILPNYHLEVKKRPENEREKRRYIRLYSRKSADYFQSIMSRVLREYMQNNPGKLSKRCNPYVPEAVVARIRTYHSQLAAQRGRKKKAWERHNPGKIAK